MLDTVVYFSSVTENTKRFVEKLELESIRIPISKKEEMPVMDNPFVLIVPTYGGGASMMGRPSRPVPNQVKDFLGEPDNVENMKCVIAGGNSNFGAEFGKAGSVIKKKFGIPYVYRFELMGNEEDVRIVKEGLHSFAF